ncbi:MAG: hypothetical protein ACRDL7_02940, partial [Gaiellaceae bacterium]
CMMFNDFLNNREHPASRELLIIIERAKLQYEERHSRYNPAAKHEDSNSDCDNDEDEHEILANLIGTHLCGATDDDVDGFLQFDRGINHNWHEHHFPYGESAEIAEAWIQNYISVEDEAGDCLKIPMLRKDDGLQCHYDALQGT